MIVNRKKPGPKSRGKKKTMIERLREIRDKISLDTMDLSFEETQKYFEERRRKFEEKEKLKRKTKKYRKSTQQI